MRSQSGFASRSYIAAVIVNGLLCTTIGALLGGLRGGQLGLVAGILLAMLPTIVRVSTAWLAQPGGLPRLIAREIGAVAIGAAAAIADALARIFGPLVRLLQVPALMLRFATIVVSGIATAILGAVGRALATPLGLANLAALAVIAVNLTSFEFATPVAFVGLGLLLLVLFVSEGEAADAVGQPDRRTEDKTTQGEHS